MTYEKPKIPESKKNLVREQLLEGEKLVVEGYIHPAIYWKSIAVFIIGLLVSLFVVREIGVILIVVSLLMAVHVTALRQILLISVTDKRILARYGLLQIDVVDLHFSKVESVELERMLPGYLFGYSNVIVMGTGNRYIVIPYVGNGIEVRQAFNKMTLENENTGGTPKNNNDKAGKND